MPRFDESRPLLVSALLEYHGPCAIGEPGLVDRVGTDEVGPFEKIAAAALGLIADPRLAASALATLREAGLLDPAALAAIDPIELEDVLKQGRVKIALKSLRPLLKLARWAADGRLDVQGASTVSTEALREAWRALRGLGPATVDAILLRGLGLAAYPVDRPTYRVLVRHGWLDPSADYDEARSAAESLAPDDPGTLARLSAALERLGRDRCKPTVARCEHCPLRSLLPEGGPREAE